jgi:hypothetical protein
VVQELEAQPRLAEDGVTLELRSSLARAADTIHLVIGGDETLVSKARRCIAEARELANRGRPPGGRAPAADREAPKRTRGPVQPPRRHTGNLDVIADSQAARRLSKKEPREAS